MPKFVIDADEFLIFEEADKEDWIGEEKVVGKKTVNVRRLKRLLSARDHADGSRLNKFTIKRLPD